MDIVRPRITHEDMVVIYDARSGRIVHRHEVVTFEGGAHPDDDAMEADAWDELEQSQPELKRQLKGAALRERFAVVRAKPDTFKPNTMYRVDPTSRRLVEAKP
jgi:hypothetical protein